MTTPNKPLEPWCVVCGGSRVRFDKTVRGDDGITRNFFKCPNCGGLMWRAKPVNSPERDQLIQRRFLGKIGDDF